MTLPSDLPSAGHYAVQLFANLPHDGGSIAGRLEHVLSGRRHDFDDGPALLACLAHEQLQAFKAAMLSGRGAPPAAPPPLPAATDLVSTNGVRPA